MLKYFNACLINLFHTSNYVILKVQHHILYESCIVATSDSYHKRKGVTTLLCEAFHYKFRR